jgi:hypothetical protein
MTEKKNLLISQFNGHELPDELVKKALEVLG